MKIVLYSSGRPAYAAKELEELFGALDRNGFTCLVNEDFAEIATAKAGITIPEAHRYRSANDIPDDVGMMICYGGDGTFLAGVRLLETRPIPMVGINSGRLGFLANINKDHLDQALADIRAGNYTTEERALLETSEDPEPDDFYPYAFNEFSVQRQAGSMISVEVRVGDEMIATYWGDGVLVSTPTGSTAYALSVGGPVVAPGCNCLVIAPISPHNLTMRPVVVPDNSRITLTVDSRDNDFLSTLDNRSYPARDGAVFQVKKAKKTIFLVHFQNISFYDTLRNKMMWGVDRRDDGR